MDDDLTISYGRARDETRFDRDGVTVTRVKVVPFFIGKHGPFTEEFPADGFDMAQVAERVTRLRDTMRNLPK